MASPCGTPRARPPLSSSAGSPFTVPRAADSTARLHERALHKVEVSLSRSQGEASELTQRLTQANLEIQTLRTQLETRTKDLTFTRRSLDRAKHEKMALQTEVETCKDSLRRLEARVNRCGGGDASVILNERCQQLAARVEQEEDSARTQKREVRRLQEDVATLKEALKMRGEVGVLQEELMQVRAERMQLAIELHDVKENLRTSQLAEQHARAETTETSAEVSALLDELRVVEAERAAAVSQAKSNATEVTSLCAKRDELTQVSADLQRQVAARDEELVRLVGQNDELIQQRERTEAILTRLQTEIEHREENFRVELSLLADKHERLRHQLQAREAENLQARDRIAELNSQLSDGKTRQRELANELHATQERLQTTAEQAAMAQRERDELQAQLAEERFAVRRASVDLATSEESGSARTFLLSQRLEVALQELQAAFQDRDRLRATLDEALSRCAASLVAKQLAEEERAILQQQLAAERLRSQD